jgi:hypothetical protein
MQRSSSSGGSWSCELYSSHERTIKLIDRSVSRLIGDGATYDELHAKVKEDLSVFGPYKGKTFKFEVESANHRTTSKRQR